MPLPFNITFEVIVNITLQVIVDMTLGAYRRDSNEEVHMAIRLVTLPTVFIAFSILTGVAAFQHGYIGIFEAGFRDAASMQVFFDLVISVSLFRIWMLVDARKRGVTVWPYLIAIPAVGSIAPLAYLIMPGVGGNRESGAP